MIAKFNGPIGRQYDLTRFNASPHQRLRKYSSYWLTNIENMISSHNLKRDSVDPGYYCLLKPYILAPEYFMVDFVLLEQNRIQTFMHAVTLLQHVKTDIQYEDKDLEFDSWDDEETLICQYGYKYIDEAQEYSLLLEEIVERSKDALKQINRRVDHAAFKDTVERVVMLMDPECSDDS